MKGKKKLSFDLLITIATFIWIVFFESHVNQMVWILVIACVLVFQSMCISKNVLDLIEGTENEDDMKKGKKLLLDKSISVLAISTALAGELCASMVFEAFERYFLNSFGFFG